MSDSVTNVFSALGTLALVILVFVAAYWCTRALGRHYGGQSAGLSSTMQVLERVALGRDSFVVIVRMDGRVVALGVTPQQVTFLQELDAADYPPVSPEPAAAKLSQFSEVLQSSLKNWGIHRPGDSNKKGDKS